MCPPPNHIFLIIHKSKQSDRTDSKHILIGLIKDGSYFLPMYMNVKSCICRNAT